MPTTLSLRFVGVLAVGLAMQSAQAAPKVVVPEELKSTIGHASGFVVKVHGVHRDCRPPGEGFGMGHRHWQDKKGGIGSVPCQLFTVPVDPKYEAVPPRRRGGRCEVRPTCLPGQRTFCVQQERPGCCLAWRRCEAIIR